MQLCRPADTVDLERQLATDFQNALANVQRTIQRLEDALEARRKEDEAKVEETKVKMGEQMGYLMRQIENISRQDQSKFEESTVKQKRRT